MKITLSGAISINVEGEWLFEGQALPLELVCNIEDSGLTFEDDKAKLRFTVPVELAVGEQEWSRAVGEVLARSILEATEAP